jgi:hypothetical protein
VKELVSVSQVLHHICDFPLWTLAPVTAGVGLLMPENKNGTSRSGVLQLVPFRARLVNATLCEH